MLTITRIPLLLVAIVLAPALRAEPATYRIDPEHFSIAFFVEHIGYAKMIGQFTQASGAFVYDEQAQQLRSGSVEVRAASVSTHHGPRDEHLRGGDFLAAERFPVVRFVAREFRPDDGARGTLRGDLTLLGQTHPVELDVKLNKAATYPFGHGKHTLGISAKTTLRRSRWGMTYGVANRMVGDDVELLFELEAIKQ